MVICKTKLFFSAERTQAGQPGGHAWGPLAEDWGGDEGQHVHRHAEVAQGDWPGKN